MGKGDLVLLLEELNNSYKNRDIADFIPEVKKGVYVRNYVFEDENLLRVSFFENRGAPVSVVFDSNGVRIRLNSLISPDQFVLAQIYSGKNREAKEVKDVPQYTNTYAQDLVNLILNKIKFREWYEHNIVR